MNTKLKIGIVAAAVLIAAIALLAAGVMRPNHIQGDVLTVRRVKLTPSESGLRASFELQNERGPKVDLWAANLTDSSTDRDIAIKTITLDKGETTTIEIDVPAKGKWQVRFAVNKHPKEDHNRGTLVYTDWFDSDEELAKKP
jgi:hypothetical protein